MFGEKCTVGSEKNFSPSDLLKFVESMVRNSKLLERRSLYKSNYSWLTSRDISYDSAENDLDEFKPIAHKLTSENCAAIAVKLETLVEESKTATEILAAFKIILEQQYSIQLMGDNVRHAKAGRNGSKNRQNKVHPELLPPGRQATVSFILN